MAYETLLVERKDQIGFISLNRPEFFNTFSEPLARELNLALEAMDAEPEVRVVIIKGEGKAFSTGIDIREFPGKTVNEYKEWSALMDKMHHTVAAMRKPVIAMVHGFAVANGAGLFAAADFAIVAEGTRIGTTAINVGLLCTGPIIPMMYALGKHKTLEMLLSGDMITAEEALQLGLVNKVVPLDQLEAETLAFAGRLLAKSPLALQLGKEFYYRAMDMSREERFHYHNELFARLCVSRDALEGVNAFLEKRKPQWNGK